jgi:hypothetical protein
MNANGNHSGTRSPEAKAFVREVRSALRQEPEVVLATSDIQSFLANGNTVDGIAVMRLLRDVGESQRWDVFVFDHGALVRIKPQATAPALVNGAATRNGRFSR